MRTIPGGAAVDGDLLSSGSIRCGGMFDCADASAGVDLAIASTCGSMAVDNWLLSEGAQKIIIVQVEMIGRSVPAEITTFVQKRADLTLEEEPILSPLSIWQMM